jgi:hypothetical protein
MTFAEMYDLTPRSFFNAVNGNRKKEDAFSKERWIMTRELMFAVMSPYLEKGIEKHDIMPFEWEQKQLKQLAAKKAEQIEAELEQLNEFWERQDNAKKGGN